MIAVWVRQSIGTDMGKLCLVGVVAWLIASDITGAPYCPAVVVLRGVLAFKHHSVSPQVYLAIQMCLPGWFGTSPHQWL